jgi:hypothetical protein
MKNADLIVESGSKNSKRIVCSWMALCPCTVWSAKHLHRSTVPTAVARQAVKPAKPAPEPEPAALAARLAALAAASEASSLRRLKILDQGKNVAAAWEELERTKANRSGGHGPRGRPASAPTRRCDDDATPSADCMEAVWWR